MIDQSTCPVCGSIMPAGGPCPACPTIHAGEVTVGGDGQTMARAPAGETAAPTSGRLLDDLAATIGPVPRVVLREVESGSQDRHRTTGASGLEGRAGRFDLTGEIARGGMGAVWRGRDNDLGRDLAIKVLLERHGDDPGLLRQFIEEAQIAGQLHHPGVVPVYELGTLGDHRPYIAMKLVHGRTLAAVMTDRDDRDATRPRLLAIFLDVAQTMAYAHARGVVHCDLKPANIMVGSFGEVQVMDWGLAKVIPRDEARDDRSGAVVPAREAVVTTRPIGGMPDRSDAGPVLGTPAYMAPEQARGEVDRIDARADVFALGSLLCEILTGRPAYTGWSVGELVRRAARGEVAGALEALAASDADADLVALAGAALAPERDDRPTDAGRSPTD